MYAVRYLVLLALATTMTDCVQAQNVEGQPIAAQYGEFQVQNEGNGFAFDPANCNVTGGGVNFPAFTTGTPVKVVDPLPAQTEVSTMVNAFQSGSECAVSLGGLAYQHTSFYLTSGTGGLQEALNNGRIHGGGNNTIILNGRWYQLIAPRTASTVISTVIGSSGFGLVDITTNPYTSYNWNGSQYVQVASSGGSPTGAAGGALSGNYPNPGLSSNPIALPAGSTATTCTPGENDTKVATNACVAASAGSGGPPSGAAGGVLGGTYPNPGFASSAVAPTATNLASGAVGSVPYQSASATTAFLASPTTSGHTFVPAWQPIGSAIIPTELDLATYLASPPPIGGTTPAAGAFSTLSATLGVSALADGTHAGYMDLVGNNANQTVVANTWGEMGPAEATYTAWAEQPANSTSGGPSANNVKVYGAPSSGVAQWTLTNAPALSAANMGSFPNVPTSTTATNIAGGALGSAPYQSAPGTTALIASPVTSGHAYAYVWQPSGSTIAPTALDFASFPAIDGITHTANATGFSIAGGTTSKTFTINNTITLAGTDGTTMTFPSVSAAMAALGIAQTFSAANTFSVAGAASTPGFTVSGAPYTGGTATTNFPQEYLNCSGATAVTTLSTAGTVFGINACSGFTGHLINLFVNGASTRFRVDYQGNTFIAGTETVASNLGLSATTAPTMAAGAAAGSSPTCTSVTGNNNSGVLSCTTGTSTTASATLATITFNGTLGTVPNGCTLFPRNALTALLATDVYTTAPTSTTFTIAVGTTAPTVSTGYVWSYLCL